MTIPDPNLERSGANPENVQDIIPPTERGLDPAVTDVLHGLTGDAARPLTADERKAADRDAPIAERVYAPASERVPVEPVPGHRHLTDHVDTQTPERQAAGQTPAEPTEPSFTRVNRPSVDPDRLSPSGWAPSSSAFPANDDAAWNSSARATGLPLGLGLGLLVVGAGIGGWTYLRWQRERNKPINRLRRQAKQAAAQIRDRVPNSPQEAAKPAAGLTTVLLSMLVLLWQAQSRSRQPDTLVDRATGAVSDVDLHERLTTLKKRWDPSRLELEKISISQRTKRDRK
ncbi:MAG: hypothetical protein ACR2IK_13645 [Chloroflexota bacterium]